MLSSTLLSSLHLFHSMTLNTNVYPRRFLLHTPLHRQPAAVSFDEAAAAPSIATTPNSNASESSFDANVVMILAVLLCALICALGLNSIVRCALRCSTRMSFEPSAGARCNTGGVRKKALKSMPTTMYSEGLKLPGADSECTICLSEFTVGERVRVLPKCNHGFHIQCIDRWLAAHSSCPTCRQCLTSGTCQKTFHCTAEAGRSGLPPPRSIIPPLDPEDPLFNYRGHY